MNQNIASQLNELVKIRKQSSQEIIADALEVGISNLYRETVLNQYVHKKISRTKAIQSIGIDRVILCEKQNQAVQADISWGLGLSGV